MKSWALSLLLVVFGSLVGGCANTRPFAEAGLGYEVTDKSVYCSGDPDIPGLAAVGLESRWNNWLQTEVGYAHSSCLYEYYDKNTSDALYFKFRMYMRKW